MHQLLNELHALPVAAKGRAFEELMRWYLENAPEYRGRLERVYLWKEWPDRWGADAGIDLVAQTATGDLWAVQAKAYRPSYSIKKSDVDSFLSESARANFSFRLLLATTDGLGANAARTLHDQEKPVGVKLLSQLTSETVGWPSGLQRLRPTRPPRKRPREHQLKAIDEVVDGFGAADRGQLLMACGTGKTLTALWIAEALDASRTVVFVPSLALLGQTLRVWTAEAEEELDYLAVCSDETVTSEDNFTKHTADLGVPVTTSSDQVGAFLTAASTKRGVVFATYHSSPVVAKAQAREGVPSFDLAVADEAHRCAGRTGSAFTTVLDENKIRADKRLFMTATPRYFAARLKSASTSREVEIASMDDKGAFGPVLSRLSFGEAIRRRLLADYQVLVIGVDEPTLVKLADTAELVLREDDKVSDARTLSRQVGLLRAVARFDLRRVVTFHGRVAAARAFAQTLPVTAGWMPEDTRPTGRVWAQHVAGTMNAGQRESRLNSLRYLPDGERALLANVRCLAEGVDVPTLDGVAFVDPRQSAVEIIQAVGRAIRPSDAKKVGTVVIPVLVQPEQSDEEVLDSSAFRPVWEVVRALRAHDDVLAEQLDSARYRLGRHGGSAEVPEKIVLDIPRTVPAEFARAFNARVVERTTSPWEFWLGLLHKYVEREGTVAQLRQSHVECGYQLGGWVGTQRRMFRRRTFISQERIRRLEAVPGWTWDKHHGEWERKFQLVARFAQREGHSSVLHTYVEDDETLGEWVAEQRKHYQRGSRRLTPERRARLESLPGWAWSSQEARWERGFSALKSYAERERHIHVPSEHVEGGVALNRWLHRQRYSYSVGRLSEASVRRLEAVPGWRWHVGGWRADEWRSAQ